MIDINPPVLAGDRAFDLATLLSCHYGHDQIRDPLRARLLDLAGPRTAAACLAHMALRQAGWPPRHHRPPTPPPNRHSTIGSIGSTP